MKPSEVFLLHLAFCLAIINGENTLPQEGAFKIKRGISDGDIRLVGGSTANEGRVEVFERGQWYTVCGKGWDLYEANVVCKQLGYEGAVAATSNGSFGEGTGGQWEVEFHCTGSEGGLVVCHTIEAFCSHSEDAGVVCSDAERSTSPSSDSNCFVVIGVLVGLTVLCIVIGGLYLLYLLVNCIRERHTVERAYIDRDGVFTRSSQGPFNPHVQVHLIGSSRAPTSHTMPPRLYIQSSVPPPEMLSSSGMEPRRLPLHTNLVPVDSTYTRTDDVDPPQVPEGVVLSSLGTHGDQSSDGEYCKLKRESAC